MILALLLAAAAPSAVDAERAFAADAQTIGQWSAFRKWAAEDATMFTPQPVKAQVWLKDRKNPAKAIDWWPTAIWVSCDRNLAIDTVVGAIPTGTSAISRRYGDAEMMERGSGPSTAGTISLPRVSDPRDLR